MTPGLEERLRLAGIEVGAAGPHYWMFVREGCLAVVPRTGSGFGALGSTGLSTERGLAYLIYRAGRPHLSGHNFELAADTEQVEKILRFSADLEAALGPAGPVE